jgi:hypothetical protein
MAFGFPKDTSSGDIGRVTYLEIGCDPAAATLTPRDDRPCCCSTSKKDASILRYAGSINHAKSQNIKITGMPQILLK